jgi:DNA-binding NarL/FixJ family response regulator
MNSLGHARKAGREDLTENQPEGTSQSGTPISIVIADDSEVYREMLKMVIEAFPGLEVLGSVGDGCQALEMVAARRPQLVLLDLQLRGLNGLQSMALIREYHPATRVIIITGDDSDDVRATCLAQGANGFISKRRLYQELPRGIAQVFPDSATGSLAKGQWAE